MRRKFYILNNLFDNYIKKPTRTKWKKKKLNENLRFIDSFKFKLAPLENLPDEQFFLLENYFEKLGHSTEKSVCRNRKGTSLLIFQLVRKNPRNSTSLASNMEKYSNRRGCECYKKRVQSCPKNFHRTEVWVTW